MTSINWFGAIFNTILAWTIPLLLLFFVFSYFIKSKRKQEDIKEQLNRIEGKIDKQYPPEK